MHDELRRSARRRRTGASEYPRPLSIEERGLDQILFLDAYRRASLRDHFYGRDLDVEALYRNEAADLGNFAQADYASSFRGTELSLWADGAVECDGPQPLRLRKTVALSPRESRAEIAYDISYDGASAFADSRG